MLVERYITCDFPVWYTSRCAMSLLSYSECQKWMTFTHGQIKCHSGASFRGAGVRWSEFFNIFSFHLVKSYAETLDWQVNRE